jgi:cytochrome P450
VVAQANTFLLAGMETTANSLAFSIYLLATHPEAEARLMAEIDALAASKAGAGSDGHVGLPDLVPEDLECLPFTSAVIDEAMRLFPAAGAAGRLVTQAVELGGFCLPPGCNALVAIYALHRDPSIWPQPEAFRPERWLPEGQDMAARKAHAFLPFGGGARMCVGYKFALQVRPASGCLGQQCNKPYVGTVAQYY